MLSGALLRTGLRDLARRPLQTTLVVCGVALGVAVVIAIDFANEGARRAFAESSTALVGRATHQITGGPSGVPQSLYRQVRVEWGVRASTPVVEGSALALTVPPEPVKIMGIDPFADTPVHAHLSDELSLGDGLDQLLSDEPAVVASRAFARRHGLELGDSLPIRVQDRDRGVRLAGLVETGGGGAALDGIFLMDVGAAQDLFEMGDRLTRIDLVSTPADAERLAARLPVGVRIVPATARTDTLEQLTAAFRLNLQALSLLALIVGMFLIYNTITFAVVQRRAVFGTLRTLGATPGQLLGLVLAEALLVSTLGTALGIPVGSALGHGALRLVSRTINDLYFVLATTRHSLTLLTIAKGAALGIVAGVASALPAAIEAARVPPVTALQASTREEMARSRLPLVTAAGLAIGTLGGAIMAMSGTSLAWSFLALLLIYVGLALCTPLATLYLMRASTGACAKLFGPMGRMAPRTVSRAIGRTGVAIAALTVAVSVTVGVSLMIDSFRETVVNWLDVTLVADLYVSAPSPPGALGRVIGDEVAPLLSAVPGVARVETYRSISVASPSGRVHLAVTDAAAGRSDESLYRLASGSPAEVWRRVREGAVVVSEPFAYRRGLLEEPSSVTLDTDRGEHSFPVAGVYYDYATEHGTVLMHRDVYERHFDDRRISSVAAYLDDGADPDAVAASARDAFGGRALIVAPTRALRRRALQVFDRTFAVTRALRLLAVVVAAVGVWSALLALQVERTRELGTLRALGATPAMLRRLTLIETGLMGVAAGVLSIPAGLLLAVLLIEVINVRSFGWTMQLSIDPMILFHAVALSLGAALLASLYPLRRLNRLSVAEAIRQE